MKQIAIIEVEYIAHKLAQEIMRWDEPIPDFGTRFPGILESCLRTPFQTFNKKHLYRELIGRASIMFYLMIKNHPFQNGNKRIAITTLLYLLYKNNRWIDVDNTELYNFARWVAESNPKLREATMLAVKKFLEVHIARLNR